MTDDSRRMRFDSNMQSLEYRYLIYSVGTVLCAPTPRTSPQHHHPAPCPSCPRSGNYSDTRLSMQLRTNLDMAQTVENGLVVDEVHGSASAWKYLAEHGVPTQVILRILVSQARRRQTDPIYSTNPR